MKTLTTQISASFFLKKHLIPVTQHHFSYIKARNLHHNFVLMLKESCKFTLDTIFMPIASPVEATQRMYSNLPA